MAYNQETRRDMQQDSAGRNGTHIVLPDRIHSNLCARSFSYSGGFSLLIAAPQQITHAGFSIFNASELLSLVDLFASAANARFYTQGRCRVARGGGHDALFSPWRCLKAKCLSFAFQILLISKFLVSLRREWTCAGSSSRPATAALVPAVTTKVFSHQ